MLFMEVEVIRGVVTATEVATEIVAYIFSSCNLFIELKCLNSAASHWPSLWSLLFTLPQVWYAAKLATTRFWEEVESHMLQNSQVLLATRWIFCNKGYRVADYCKCENSCLWCPRSRQLRHIGQWPISDSELQCHGSIWNKYVAYKQRSLGRLKNLRNISVTSCQFEHMVWTGATRKRCMHI